MEIVTPKKTTPISPDQHPLISEPEAPAVAPIDPDTLRRVRENQAAVREEREKEAEKPDYTDI